MGAYEGLADRIVNYVSQHQDVPPWGLTILLPYAKSDAADLKELEECVVKIRRLVKVIIERMFVREKKALGVCLRADVVCHFLFIASVFAWQQNRDDAPIRFHDDPNSDIIGECIR